MRRVSDAAPLVGKVMRDVSGSFGTSVAIQACNVFTGVLIARHLGPTGKGELTAIVLWPALLAAVADLGLFDASVFFTARQDGRESNIFATTVSTSLLLAAAAGAVGWWVIPMALGHVGSDVVWLGRLFLIRIPLYFLTLSAMTILQGKTAFAAYNACRFYVGGLNVLGFAALDLSHQFTVENATIVYLLANCLAGALAAGLLWRRGWVGGHFDFALLRRMLGYGIRSHAGNLSSVANQQGDQMLISAFLPPYQLGIYSAAVSLTAAVTLIGGSTYAIAFPLLSGLEDPTARAQLLGRLTRLTFVASLVVAIVLAFAVPSVVEAFFGAAFLPSVTIARLLLLASVLLSTKFVLVAGLQACGWPFGVGVAETIAALVTLASLVVLLPTVGLIGAVVASLLAYGTSTCVILYLFHSRLGIRWDTLVTPRYSDFSWAIGQIALIAARKRRQGIGW